MNDKSIYRRALKLAVPMMIQNGITNMVTLVDNVMVGSLGTEAMTAVSIVGQLILFLVWLFSGEYPGGYLRSPILRSEKYGRISQLCAYENMDMPVLCSCRIGSFSICRRESDWIISSWRKCGD